MKTYTHKRTIRQQQAIARKGEQALIKLLKYEDAETGDVFEMELNTLFNYGKIVEGGIFYRLTPSNLRITSRKTGFYYSSGSIKLEEKEVKIFEELHKGFILEVDVDEKLDSLLLLREDASEKVKKNHKLMEFFEGLLYNYIENTKDIPYSLERGQVRGTDEKVETKQAIEIAKKEVRAFINEDHTVKTKINRYFDSTEVIIPEIDLELTIVSRNKLGTTVLKLNEDINNVKYWYYSDLRSLELEHLLELNAQNENYRKCEKLHHYQAEETKQATPKQKQATPKQATPKQKQERQEKQATQAEETKQEKKQTGGIIKMTETHPQTIRQQQAITRNGEPAVIKLFKYEDAETGEVFEMELGALLYSTIVEGGIFYRLIPSHLRIVSQKPGFDYSLVSKDLEVKAVKIFEELHKGFTLGVDVDEKLDRLVLLREDAEEKVKKIDTLMKFCEGLFYNYIENTKDIPYSLEDEKVQGTNEKIETEKAVEIAKKELEECVNGEFNIQVSGSFKTFITIYGSVEYFEVIKDNTKGTTVLELNRKINTFKGLYFKDLRKKELEHLLELNRQTEKYRKIKDYREEFEKIKKAEKMEESKKREEHIKKLMEDYRKQQATKQAETKQTPKQAKTKQAKTKQATKTKQASATKQAKQAEETKQATKTKQASATKQEKQRQATKQTPKQATKQEKQAETKQEETKQAKTKQQEQKQETKQQKQEPKQQEPKQQKQEGKPEKMEDDINMAKMDELIALCKTLEEKNTQAIEKIEQLEETIEKNKPLHKKISDKVKKAKASAVAKVKEIKASAVGKVEEIKASAVGKVEEIKASAVGAVIAILPQTVKEEIKKQGNQAEEPKQAEEVKQAEPKQAEPKQAEPKQAEEVKQAEPKQAEETKKQTSPIDAKIENIKKTNIKKILAEQGDEVVHFFNLKTIYRVQTISGKIYNIKKDKTAEEIAEMLGE